MDYLTALPISKKRADFLVEFGGSDFQRAVVEHAKYFSEFAERQGKRLKGAGVPDGGIAQLAALHSLRAELDNLLAVFELSCVQTNAAWLLSISAALDRYFHMLGEHRACLGISRRLLAVAKALDQAELELRALLSHVKCFVSLGDHREALKICPEALTLVRELRSRRLEAELYQYLGTLAGREVDLQQAEAHSRTVMEIYREQGDPWGIAVALNGVGLHEGAVGNFESAAWHFNESIVMRRSIGDLNGEAGALHNLGGLAEQKGDLRVAADIYAKALAINLKVGNLLWQQHNLDNLGRVKRKWANSQRRTGCSTSLLRSRAK